VQNVSRSKSTNERIQTRELGEQAGGRGGGGDLKAGSPAERDDEEGR